MISVRNAFRLSPWAAVLLAAALGCGSATASDRWLTSYEAAMEAAQKLNQPVLTIFTGSDWCPHCRTLEDNVLASETFLDWADGKVVLTAVSKKTLLALKPLRDQGVDRALFDGKPLLVAFFASW